MGLSADVTALRRARAELLEMQPLPYNPSSPFANTRFDFAPRSTLWGNHVDLTIGVNRYSKRSTGREPQTVVELVNGVRDSAVHRRQSGIRARAILSSRSIMSSM